MSTANVVTTVDASSEPAADKGFWAKCSDPECGHCWIAAYFPMEVAKFARIAMQSKLCPKCGAKKPVVAKQENGVLMEPRP